MHSPLPHPPVLPAWPTLTFCLSLWVMSWHTASPSLCYLPSFVIGSHPPPHTLTYPVANIWLMGWTEHSSMSARLKDNDRLSISCIVVIKLLSTVCPSPAECVLTCVCVCVYVIQALWSCIDSCDVRGLCQCARSQHLSWSIFIFFLSGHAATPHTHKHTQLQSDLSWVEVKSLDATTV